MRRMSSRSAQKRIAKPARKSNLTTMDDGTLRAPQDWKPAVRREFKDSPLIKRATKDRILAIARRHGYSVNWNAQKLRTNRTKTVAVVMHLPPQTSEHVSAPFFFQLATTWREG